jgi:ParB-like chromosome segregation protein Spo0J
MSRADNAEVLQGRLGWESGDISEANPEELQPHPKNTEIYGDTDDIGDLDETFKESVAEKGVLEPLVITNGKEIISGHRRWLAAKDAGLDSVPVRYSEFENDLAEREALIEFNRQREKTPGQIVNEFEEMLEVEKQRAKERKEDATGHREKFHEAESGRAKDKAAEKVNADVSGRTLEKGKNVKEKAESDDEPEEVQEVAKKEWEKLKDGKTSFHTASKNVEKAEAQAEIENERDSESEDSEPITIQQTTADELLKQTQSADLLLTDPPYTTDVDDIDAFARSWVPKALDVIGDDGLGFIFVGAYADELQTYLNVLDECGVRDRTQVLVWTYKNTLGQTPNNEYKRNWQAVLFIQSEPSTEIDAPLTSEQWAVQEINAPDGRHDGRHHKWEKPTDIIERFIRHTTAEGDTIVDPFVGTGTTAIVADELNREVRAGDKSSDMLEIAEERGCVVDE